MAMDLCSDCRYPLPSDSHHDHNGLCCDCFDESIGMPGDKRRVPRPIIKPASLVIRDKKLLVVRTRGQKHYYTLGGKLEKNETELECLGREAREEVGCGIINPQYYKTFTGLSEVGAKFVVMICYLAELDGEPKPCSEIESLCWVNTESTEPLSSLLREHIMPALLRDGLLGVTPLS